MAETKPKAQSEDLALQAGSVGGGVPSGPNIKAEKRSQTTTGPDGHSVQHQLEAIRIAAHDPELLERAEQVLPQTGADRILAMWEREAQSRQDFARKQQEQEDQRLALDREHLKLASKALDMGHREANSGRIVGAVIIFFVVGVSATVSWATGTAWPLAGIIAALSGLIGVYIHKQPHGQVNPLPQPKQEDPPSLPPAEGD